MSDLDSPRTEALLQLQTRQVPMPGGRTHELTYTILFWRALEYLLDREYFTIEYLVELANVDGWPPHTPFEMRLSAVVAYWTRRNDAAHRDFSDYCEGKL